MSKRQRLTIWDLGRVPVTEVAREKSVGSLRDFRNQLALEDQQARDAEQQKLENAQRDYEQTLREVNKSQKELTSQLWGRELDCISNPDSWSGELAADSTIGLKDSANKFDIHADASTLRAVAVEFELNMKELTGYTFNEDGAKRLLYFGFAQAIHGKDLTTVSAWQTCFERLLACNCFDDGEIEFHPNAKKVEQPRVEEETLRRATMDDLMNVDCETRDGLRRARNIGEELYIEEFLPMATEWVSSLQKNFGFSPTPDDMIKVSNWIQRNNLSRIDPRTYDAARRWMVSSGFWSNGCLMEMEKYSRDLEQVDLTRITHEQKQNLRRREQQAREADARRFGSGQ